MIKNFGFCLFLFTGGLLPVSPSSCESADLPGQGEECAVGDLCATGLDCVHYFGIAGPSGPEFTSCEIPCEVDAECPADQECVMIADGPGDVCRPVKQLACDPMVEASCPEENVCVAESVSEAGECRPFDHGQTVGAGYSCGGSIGVSCAEGLFCAGLPHGLVGGSGTCTLMACSDWMGEYDRMVEYLGRCDAADECVGISGTSCGCTRNLVLNKDSELGGFWSLVEQMNQAGCGIATTCDCPPADGYLCEDGHCAWNYL